MSSFDLLYEDGGMIAVNKPSGLLCVPGLKVPDNLYDCVKTTYPGARVVHRLDMSTSGIVLFALNAQTHRALCKLFENKKIHKTYKAIVHGSITAHCGEIESPLACDWPNRPRHHIQWLSGKASSTYFFVEQRKTSSTRVALFPKTGRTHQLRLHMLQIGHPILGDALYKQRGSETLWPRLALHAARLELPHPVSGKILKLACSTPF